MSTRNFVEEFEYNDAKGLDTTSPTSMVGEGFVREAQNINLGPTGGYIKRDGFTEQLSSKWTGTSNDMSIRQGFEYRIAGGTAETILFGTDNSGDSRLGKVDAGAVTDILTGLAPTQRLSMVQFEDRLFGFNGDSVNAPFIYEGGLSTRNLGIAAPLVAPTTAAAAGGSLNVGSYVVAYTYVIKNSSTGQVIAESSPSLTATQVVSSGEDQIDVDVVASTTTVSGSLEILIRIYQTVVAGSVLFQAEEVNNATATISLTDADAALGDIQLPLDNSQLDIFNGYTKARFPIVARNRLFVAHENRNEVRFSKIGQEASLPESFPAVSFVTVEGKQGSADKFVGMGQIKGVPIILKERSIGRLEEVGLPEITRAEDPVTYLYREISDSIGAVTHDAQTQVFDELIFLSRDNIYATNGFNSPRAIATSIQGTIKDLDFRDTKNSRITMVNDTKNRRILIQVFELVTDAEPALVLVGDYQQYPIFRWTTYNQGSNSVTHPGIRAGSYFQLTSPVDGTTEVYFGNTDKNGQYYKMNDSTADEAYVTGGGITAGDDIGIAMRLVSRPYSMGQPLVTKLFQNTRIFAEAADDTYSLEFCSIFDLSVEEEFCQLFVIPGIGDNWDEENWVDDAETEGDPLIWAGPRLAELTHNPHRKAKFMQLVLNQSDKDAPVTLLGWGVSGSIFGGV